MSQLTAEDFVEMVLAGFTELREEIEEDSGLPHVQMGTFARLMQQAKGRADWDTYARAARIADALWSRADAGLRNALNVSLLENLDFDGARGPHAWSLLSPRLQRAWSAMRAYNEWLRAGAKGKPPAQADV
jgi:hypothetical protein